jgi:hypothetical protein
MWKRDMTPEEAAQVIERFLAEAESYPFEWRRISPRHDKRIQESNNTGNAVTS